METHLGALTQLVAIARADGEITREESVLIDRYRRALGVSECALRMTLEQAELTPLSSDEIQGSDPERVAAIKMMVRVAFADGVLCRRERLRLERVAVSLQVQPLQFADLLVAVEEEIFHRKRTRRLLLGVAGSLVVGLIALGVNLTREEASGSGGALPSNSSLDPRALEGVPSNAAFKRIRNSYSPSVLLIVVWYDLVRGGERLTKSGAGTGFFVTPAGHIATSKHLIRPWTYRAEVVRLIDEQDFRVDPNSIRIAAWPGESDLRSGRGRLNLATAYHTGQAEGPSLEVFRIPPDDLERRRERLPDGTFFVGTFHVRDNSDIAVLKARVPQPVVPLRIAPESECPEPLDSVMILGYPGGLKILESNRAVPSPCPGAIRKIEETIFMTTPIHPGNSGGPTIDRNGFVLGVVTRYVTDPNLSCCIRTEHLVSLLPSAEELMTEGRRFVEKGYLGAGLDQFNLALRKGLTPEKQARVEGDIERILTERDDLVEKLKRLRADSRPEEEIRRCQVELDRKFSGNWVPDPSWVKGS